jgi:hypothetical protein
LHFWILFVASSNIFPLKKNNTREENMTSSKIIELEKNIEHYLDVFGVSRSLLFVFLLDLCLYAYVYYCLLTLDHPECEACYYESLEFNDRQQGKFTL